MYQSTPLPLFSWRQLQQRVDRQFEKEAVIFVQSLEAKSANLDTAPVLLERAAQVRANVPIKFMRLEQLLAISLQIEAQLRREIQRTDIADIQTQLEKLTLLSEKILLPLSSQAPRLEDEDDLLNSIKSMRSLANSGNGDTIQEEKRYLRNIVRPVRPIGQEDGEVYDQRYKSLATLMNSQEAAMTGLYHNVKVSLQFPAGMENLLNEFDIPCSFVAPEPVVAQAEDQAPESESTPNESYSQAPSPIEQEESMASSA